MGKKGGDWSSSPNEWKAPKSTRGGNMPKSSGGEWPCAVVAIALLGFTLLTILGGVAILAS